MWFFTGGGTATLLIDGTFSLANVVVECVEKYAVSAPSSSSRTVTTIFGGSLSMVMGPVTGGSLIDGFDFGPGGSIVITGSLTSGGPPVTLASAPLAASHLGLLHGGDYRFPMSPRPVAFYHIDDPDPGQSGNITFRLAPSLAALSGGSTTATGKFNCLFTVYDDVPAGGVEIIQRSIAVTCAIAV